MAKSNPRYVLNSILNCYDRRKGIKNEVKKIHLIHITFLVAHKRGKAKTVEKLRSKHFPLFPVSLRLHLFFAFFCIACLDFWDSSSQLRVFSANLELSTRSAMSLSSFDVVDIGKYSKFSRYLIMMTLKQTTTAVLCYTMRNFPLFDPNCQIHSSPELPRSRAEKLIETFSISFSLVVNLFSNLILKFSIDYIMKHRVAACRN